MNLLETKVEDFSLIDFFSFIRTSLDKWLIPDLGKEMPKENLENTVIPESKEAIRGLSKRFRSHVGEVPTGQSWDNFSISKDNIYKRLKLIFSSMS